MSKADSFMEKFNSGAVISLSRNGGYKNTTFTISEVNCVRGVDSQDEYYQAKHSDKLLLEFKLSFEGDKELVAYQFINLDDDGNMKNPILPTYVGNDGTTRPATLAYDIWESVKESLTEEEIKKIKETKGFDKKARFEGRTFTMGLKTALRKNGDSFYVLETSYQKQRDDMYKARQGSSAIMESISVDEALQAMSETTVESDRNALPFQ